MFLVIAYDVSNDKRRLRLAKELERWGSRTQFSVFECDLTPAQEAQMLARLKDLCQEDDALRIYRLCTGCVQKSVIIAGKRLALDEDFYQV